jgi:CBS domain protein
VRHAMTWDVVTTHPETTLEHATRVMVYGRFGSLPVFDGTRLVGILTGRDPLKAMSLLMPEPPLKSKAFSGDQKRYDACRDRRDRGRHLAPRRGTQSFVIRCSCWGRLARERGEGPLERAGRSLRIELTERWTAVWSTES